MEGSRKKQFKFKITLTISQVFCIKAGKIALERVFLFLFLVVMILLKNGDRYVFSQFKNFNKYNKIGKYKKRVIKFTPFKIDIIIISFQNIFEIKTILKIKLNNIFYRFQNSAF